jgi:succinate-semialdehyde dehydrogenase/glutarate-semialdehyde dehydrogenase
VALVSIATTDPTTGRVVKTFEAFTPEAVKEKLSLATDTFARTRASSFAHRAEKMVAAAAILENDKRRLGELMTLEMGKPIKAAIAEAEKCAGACRYYAENAAAFLADRKVAMDAGEAWIAFQPLGPVLAIMPWNFPFWQVFRFAAPALMAGNVGLLKHSSNVPQCALAIEDIFLRAGFERGAFQTLLISSGAIAEVIGDPRVVAVTLTGSEAAGRSVAEQAGRNLKKTVLELGGSDPFIVLPSADLDAAVTTAVTARMINNGQSCIAAKRFIVHQSIYEDFLKRFVAKVSAVRVGNPMDESTELGPLATAAIRDDLHRQVERTITKGGRLLTGGKARAGAGFFYEPTVIDRIPAGSPAAKDELFGPVASVFEAKDLADAIAIANSTSFGLGASAWTNESIEREKLIAEIEAGVLFINDMVASDSRLPFGGVKSSGYGRELSDFGIREFVNVKTVRIAATKKRPPEAGAARTE